MCLRRTPTGSNLYYWKRPFLADHLHSAPRNNLSNSEVRRISTPEHCAALVRGTGLVASHKHPRSHAHEQTEKRSSTHWSLCCASLLSSEQSVYVDF